MTELENALKKTRDSTPEGMIRNLSRAAKQHFLCLYNQFWETSQYLKGWQEAIVTPILKEGKNPNDPTSYKPISLTYCLYKVLESIVNYRLIHYLETRDANIRQDCANINPQ